jgi:hypothetical protein
MMDERENILGWDGEVNKALLEGVQAAGELGRSGRLP